MKRYNPVYDPIMQGRFPHTMVEAKDGKYFKVKDVVEKIKELTGFDPDGLKEYTKRFIAAHQRKTG